MTKLMHPPPPERCNICEAPLATEVYDSRTRSGRWGYLCHDCWKRECGRLGIGFAQHYKKTIEGWVKQ